MISVPPPKLDSPLGLIELASRMFKNLFDPLMEKPEENTREEDFNNFLGEFSGDLKGNKNIFDVTTILEFQ